MGNSNLKVSIMIPTYNQEEYIAQAIESALMQDYENLEIIIADDCSTDKTGEIARKYETDPRVKYFRNEKNLGRVGNYHNTLYKHTTGDWIVNLDGDDYYTDRTFISRAIRRISGQKNVVCYFGRRYLSSKLHKYSHNLIEKDTYLFDGKFYFMNYFRIGGFAHLVTLYKKDVAIKDGKCYTYNGVQSDFHGIIRLCSRGNIIVAKEDGYKWRIHNTNASVSIDFYQKYLSELNCQKLILEDMDKISMTEIDKSVWLKEGEKWAYRDYVTNNLVYAPSLQSILLGLKNFRFDKNYIIILIKSIYKMVCRALKIRE